MTAPPTIFVSIQDQLGAGRTWVAYNVRLPELRGEGPTHAAALACLADRLVNALGGVDDEFHREIVHSTLVDVQCTPLPDPVNAYEAPTRNL